MVCDLNNEDKNKLLSIININNEEDKEINVMKEEKEIMLNYINYNIKQKSKEITIENTDNVEDYVLNEYIKISNNNEVINRESSNNGEVITKETSNNNEVINKETSNNNEVITKETSNNSEVINKETSNNNEVIHKETSNNYEVITKKTSNNGEVITKETSNNNEVINEKTSNKSEVITKETSNNNEVINNIFSQPNPTQETPVIYISDNEDDLTTDYDTEEETNDTTIPQQVISNKRKRWEPITYLNNGEIVYRKRIKKNIIIYQKNIRDLYIKDKCLFSDKTYKLYNNLSKNTSSSSLYSLQNYRKLLNLKIIKEFNISAVKHQQKELVFCSLKKLLYHYLLYHIKWLQLIEKNNKILLQEKDKEILKFLKNKNSNFTTSFKTYIRLNLDGTPAAGENKVVFSIAPINLRSFGSFMTRVGVFPLAMWYGKEKDFRYICKIFKQEIKDILNNGIIVENIKFTFDFFVTMDWAAIKSISSITKEEFCFYCNTTNPYCSHDHLKRTVDELGLLLGLGPSKIILCLLHLKENVVKYFLKIILNSSIVKEDEIIKLIKSIPTFSYFKINKELLNDDKLKLYVTGKQCDNFFNNIHIFKDLIEKEDYLLFTKFIHIINILNNSTKAYTNEEIDNIEELINDFSNLYIKKYSINTNKCWYLHLFNNHMISILKIYLNIKIFENQNFEAAHIDDEEFLENTTKNGGTCRNYLKIFFQH